nr:ribonuclease mrp protein subunit rmp1 [Quercus suber]
MSGGSGGGRQSMRVEERVTTVKTDNTLTTSFGSRTMRYLTLEENTDYTSPEGPCRVRATMLRDSITPEDQKNLQHSSSILHLFHHRNKNQHRHSLWWRHFSVFRRQLNYLVKDAIELNTTPVSHVARNRKKFRDSQLQTRLRQRLSFWQQVLVPKWQRAFSQTTADKRFAVLGLVLLAVLADVCATTGVTTVLEDLAQVAVEQVLEKFAREEWKPDLLGAEPGAFAEDLGEVIGRNMVGSAAVANAESETVADQEKEGTDVISDVGHVRTGLRKPSSLPSLNHDVTSDAVVEQKKKKKRRKGGNAIDDLFADF